MASPLFIRYRFEFPDDSISEFSISLDTHTLEFITGDSPPPSWCKLETKQCSNCPLNPEEVPYCPLARAVSPLIGEFSGRTSYDNVTITVTTNERTVSAYTTLQRGLSSMLGLVMATSGCPHTLLFRPMARFHLPFASSEETTYRAAANYLLSQYFCEPEKQDWKLQGLADAYNAIQKVNIGIANRLKLVCEKDAAVNAVILLDLFAKDIPYTIQETLQELKPLFHPTPGKGKEDGDDEDMFEDILKDY